MCIRELQLSGSCNANPCHFNHEISVEDRNKYALGKDNAEKDNKQHPTRADTNVAKSADFCEEGFRNFTGKCSNRSCQNDHNFDIKKLKHGICFRELRRKTSCARIECPHSHDIPAKCRSDKKLVEELVK